MSFLRIRPLEKGPDTIAAAIAREMVPEIQEPTDCEVCNEVTTKTSTRSFDAVPEYIRIQIDASVYEGNDLDWSQDRGTQKIQTPIACPDILEFTQYMTISSDRGADALPVRYKLHSVIYHIGTNLAAGHYVAGVTGSKAKFARGERPRYMCNDNDVTEIQPSGSTDPNVLTRNPTGYRKEQDASILYYERMPQEKRETTRVIIDTETIAERVGRGLHRQCRKVRESGSPGHKGGSVKD